MPQPYSPTGYYYCGLLTGVVQTDGAGNITSLPEVSGNGYARLNMTGDALWSLTGNIYSNVDQMPFGTPTGSGWGSITGVAFFSAATGGVLLPWGTFSSPMSAPAGTAFTLPAGWIKLYDNVVQGPTGPQGSQGSTGPQGIAGSQGSAGPQGNPGPQGSIGPQGFQGNQGPQGYQGTIGAQGSNGPQGATGSQGPQGYQGYQGAAGSGVAAGSSGQMQYNSGGSFAGSAALTYATTGNLLTSTAQAATDVPVTIKGTTSQSANLTEWESSTGTVLLAIDPNGYLYQATTPLLHTYATGRPGTSVFLGQNAGNFTSTSTYDGNIGLGDHALVGLTTGYQNTAVGGYAGSSMSSGHYNTLLGMGAGQSLTTGYANTAIGYGCLSNCTTGYYNVAIGYNAVQSLVDGNSVIGIGYGALNGATSVNDSVVVGSGFGSATSISYSISLGYSNFTSETGGSQLIAIGSLIAKNGTNSQGVIGIGYANWYNASSYTNSIAIGNQACLNRNGTYCVAIGDNVANPAGATLSGDYCTFLGASSGSGTTDNVTNSIALGYNAQVTTSNTCQIGDVGANAVNVQTAGTIATGNSATASRPTTTKVGAQWFDTTLGRPIWFNGSAWIDATGATA